MLACVFIWGLGCLVASLTARVELPHSNQPVQLICRQCGDDLRGSMLTAIRQARHSVLIAVYTLSDPHLIEACNDAARSGVQVRVATDREQTSHLRQLLAPEVSLLTPPGSGLMHRKILVVDGRWVWIGSANYTSASLCIHDNLTLGLEAPGLAQWLERHYEALFSGEKPPGPYTVSMEAKDQRLQVWLMPESSALDPIIEQIDQARETIQLALFAWTHPELTYALQRAIKRGVKVEAVVDQTAARGSSIAAVKKARRAGIRVLERGGRALCHHKLAIIDDEQLITGSANWTRSAFEKNRECVIRVSPLSQEQRQRCHAIWKQLTREEPATALGPHWLWEDGEGCGSSCHETGPSDCSEDQSERAAA